MIALFFISAGKALVLMMAVLGLQIFLLALQIKLLRRYRMLVALAGLILIGYPVYRWARSQPLYYRVMRKLLAQRKPSPPLAPSGCPIFPANNVWNTPIMNLPVHPLSEKFSETMGADTPLHPDFGTEMYSGIPFTLVDGRQPKVPIKFTDGEPESDPGPYPIPLDAPIEGSSVGENQGDRHVIVVDIAQCKLYELFGAVPQRDGSWRAGSGAKFDLRSNLLRPAGWTSADAAGLPILPGLIRYEEVAAGEIRHAIRFTTPRTRGAWVWPARHRASPRTEPWFPPMGQRFRLRADFDTRGFSPEMQVILRAFKLYGLILSDNGAAWYVTGAPDSRWKARALRDEFARVRGGDFIAVDVKPMMVDPNSGEARVPPTQ
jgi:hypothetical protein